MTGPGGQLWFSAAELAALRLPGLSSAARKINLRAGEERWALRTAPDGSPLVRLRTGQGGGREFHVAVLPTSARLALVKAGLAADFATGVAAAPGNVVALPATRSGTLWAWYDRQPATAKVEAETRAAALRAVEALQTQGLTRTAAIAAVAAQAATGSSTLYAWVALVAGVAPHDRLPSLCPRRRGGGAEADVDPELWTIYKSDYLRFEAPTHSSCHRRLVRIAAERGVALPSAKTLQRKLERETDPAVIVATRTGAEAVRKLIPAQTRSVADLAAMELVNIDGHKWDVFVRWPDVDGRPGRVGRPMMIAIADVHSRKFLAWRIGETESAVETRLCFADLFKNFGIPRGCLMDNGRAFASKWITGGAATRFRFKIKADEPLGLLIQLGIQNHWATPYRGQSKPIERGFRDFCSDIAKHPAFAGAYTGNNINAKPENYASTAVPLDLFRRIVDQEIAAHNARPGRRTEMARGESFDAVFDRSIAAGAPVGRASPEQMRLALLAAERVTADRTTGAIAFAGNRYWCDGISAIAGQRLTIRFDPDNLHSEVHAYAADGRFVATVPVYEAAGFLDIAAARTRAKQAGEHRRAVAEQVRLAGLMDAADLAAVMPGHVVPETPQPRVIRPTRVRGNLAVAAQIAPSTTAFMDRFAAGEARDVPAPPAGRMRSGAAGFQPAAPVQPPLPGTIEGTTIMASQPSPTPDTEVDVVDIRARLNDAKTARGYSWSRLAQLTGVPQGTISAFGGGTYAGDNAGIAARVARWFVRDAEQAELADDAVEVPAFVDTRGARDVFALLRWAQRGKIVTVVAAPGFGKTSACRQYQAQRSQVWIATMSPSTQGVPNMLVELLAVMGQADAKGSPQQLSRRIRHTVTGTGGLIIVDEAQHLSEASLEELRSIHDATGIGLALVGNERVQTRLEGGARKTEFAQLFSRVSMTLRQKTAHADDAAALAEAWRVTDPAMTAFLCELALKPGGLRGVTMTLELASLLAVGEDSRLAVTHLRDAWAQLSSRPLAA